MNFFDTDSYKVSHWKQYPYGTTRAMSYIEARGGADEIRFFGLQHILNQLKVPTRLEVDAAAALAKAHFGREDIFNYEGWSAIAAMGFFPLRVKALPEGTVVPTRVPLVTVENTIAGFEWLVSWFETQFLRVWYPTSVATISHQIKQLIAGYLEKNGTPEAIGFKLHDFGSRGASTPEAAGVGGMAHLINFMGTDTLKAFEMAMLSYNADPSALGFSIPASEHSTITSWGIDFEIDAYRNMIEQYGAPGALYACVSDSYNIWEALKMWKELEPVILLRGGTLVVRPDSGDPVDTPVGVIVELMDLFGYTVNEKGYRVLPDHVRVIQGDGIDYDSIEEILSRLDNLEISADNIAFGMGGALLQKVNRDTFKFAMKTCAITVHGEERDVFKDPVTDPGKASKKGYLTVTEGFETVRIRDLGDRKELLRPVWENGSFLITQTFDEVRETR